MANIESHLLSTCNAFGDLDVWATNFSEEANYLMANNGQGYFVI